MTDWFEDEDDIPLGKIEPYKGVPPEDDTEIRFTCSFASGKWTVEALGKTNIVSLPCIAALIMVIRCTLESEVGTLMVVDEDCPG